jgi:hypothetical protein
MAETESAVNDCEADRMEALYEAWKASNPITRNRIETQFPDEREMNTQEIFPSKWLAANDLEENGWTVTIKDIVSNEFQDGTVKFVVMFEEAEKGLMLNKVNMKTIEGLYGNETDDWIGKKVHLYPTEVLFNKQMVPCIRIRNRVPGSVPAGKRNGVPATAKTTRPAPAAKAATTEATAADGGNEQDIPF